MKKFKERIIDSLNKLLIDDEVKKYVRIDKKLFKEIKECPIYKNHFVLVNYSKEDAPNNFYFKNGESNQCVGFYDDFTEEEIFRRLKASINRKGYSEFFIDPVYRTFAIDAQKSKKRKRRKKEEPLKIKEKTTPNVTLVKSRTLWSDFLSFFGF